MTLLQRTCLGVALILSPFVGCGSDDETKKPSGPVCGNGKIEAFEDGAMEECDPGNGSDVMPDLGSATCASATMMSTSTGTLSCSASCQLVTTACMTPSTGGTGGTSGSGGMGGGGMGGMSGGGMGGALIDGGSDSSATGGGTADSGTGTPDASADSSAEGGPGNGGGGPP